MNICDRSEKGPLQAQMQSQLLYHPRGYHARLAVDKMKDAVLCVCFPDVFPVCEERTMTPDKAVAQCFFQFFYGAGELNLTVFGMKDNLVYVAGSFKKENVVIIDVDSAFADFNGIGFMGFICLQGVTFQRAEQTFPIFIFASPGLSFSTKSIASTRY